jgi:hypothetical protein
VRTGFIKPIRVLRRRKVRKVRKVRRVRRRLSSGTRVRDIGLNVVEELTDFRANREVE